MNIDTQVVARYLQSQRDMFRELQKIVPSNFNEGIIQGMNLALTFIGHYEEEEGKAIARHLDSQQHAKEENSHNVCQYINCKKATDGDKFCPKHREEEGNALPTREEDDWDGGEDDDSTAAIHDPDPDPLDR